MPQHLRRDEGQRLQTLLDVAAPTATLEREHAASLHMTAEEEATRGVVTAVDVGAPGAAAGRQPHPPPHDAAAVQQQQGRGVVSLADTGEGEGEGERLVAGAGQPDAPRGPPPGGRAPAARVEQMVAVTGDMAFLKGFESMDSDFSSAGREYGYDLMNERED